MTMMFTIVPQQKLASQFRASRAGTYRRTRKRSLRGSGEEKFASRPCSGATMGCWNQGMTPAAVWGVFSPDRVNGGRMHATTWTPWSSYRMRPKSSTCAWPVVVRGLIWRA